MNKMRLYIFVETVSHLHIEHNYRTDGAFFVIGYNGEIGQMKREHENSQTQ